VSDLDLNTKVNPQKVIPHSPANHQDCDETAYEILECITERFGKGNIVDPHPIGAARMPKDVRVSARAPAEAIRRSYEMCAPAVSLESPSLSPIISELEARLKSGIVI